MARECYVAAVDDTALLERDYGNGPALEQARRLLAAAKDAADEATSAEARVDEPPQESADEQVDEAEDGDEPEAPRLLLRRNSSRMPHERHVLALANVDVGDVETFQDAPLAMQVVPIDATDLDAISGSLNDDDDAYLSSLIHDKCRRLAQALDARRKTNAADVTRILSQLDAQVGSLPPS